MVEKSSFLIVMGDSPKMRVLDFLLTYDVFDYSLSDIAENSGVGYTTLMEFWPSLIKTQIVEETRRVGRARMFRINKKNPAVKLLSKLYWEISKIGIRSTLKHQAKYSPLKINSEGYIKVLKR